MPHMSTFAQSITQPVVQFSKLVKKAKQLGCKTFSDTIDVVAVKNWLKRDSNTLTNMELDDKLKLRVSTKLINKSIATW